MSELSQSTQFQNIGLYQQLPGAPCLAGDDNHHHEAHQLQSDACKIVSVTKHSLSRSLVLKMFCIWVVRLVDEIYFSD